MSPTWDFEVQSGVITTGAQYQNTGLCGFGSSDPVQLPVLLTADICLDTITQVIPTVAGQTYSITYQMDVGVGNADSPGIFAAVFDGTAHLPSAAMTETIVGNSVLFQPAPADFLQNPPAGCAQTNFCTIMGVLGGPNEQFETDIFTAVATGSATTLEFVETCLTCDVGIQSVEVTAVSEPGILSMFGIGLLGLGVRPTVRRYLAQRRAAAAA